MKRGFMITMIAAFLILLPGLPAYADELVNGGTYYLSNNASGKVLDVYGNVTFSTAKSNVQVYTKSSGSSNYSQQFIVKKASGGWYSMIPKSNTSLAVNPFADAPKDGTNVNVYKLDAADKSQGWYFEKNGASYVIRNAYNNKIVLTASGTGDKANVKVAAYSASNRYQLWTLTNTVSPAAAVSQTGTAAADAAQAAASAASQAGTAASEASSSAASQAGTAASEASASAASQAGTAASETSSSAASQAGSASSAAGSAAQTADQKPSEAVSQTAGTSVEALGIKSGEVYCFTNKGAGRVLDVKGDENKSKNKANVRIYNKTGTGGNRSQQFKLTKTAGGWFSITVVNNTSLALNACADQPKNKTNVNIYKKITSDKTQGWYIDGTARGYVIRNAGNKKLVLSAVSSKNGANVRLETFNAKNRFQFWDVTEAAVPKASSGAGKSSAGSSTKSQTNAAASKTGTAEPSAGSSKAANTPAANGKTSTASSGSAAVSGGKQVISNAKLKDIVKKVGTQEGHASWKSMCAATCVAYVRYWRTGVIKTAPQMGGTNAKWGNIGTKAYVGKYKGKDSALYAKIRDRLNKGKVCILHVCSKLGQHWVVVYGYTGKGASQKELLVLDPWDGKYRSLTKMIYRLHSDRRLIYY